MQKPKTDTGQAIEAFFQELDVLAFHPLPEIFLFDLSCEGSTLQCRLKIQEDSEGLLLTAAVPVQVPPARRSAVREALNHLNASMLRGAWILSGESGCIQLRQFARLDGRAGPIECLRELLGGCMALAERTVHRLLAVAFGQADPVVTAESIISAPDSDPPDDHAAPLPQFGRN